MASSSSSSTSRSNVMYIAYTSPVFPDGVEKYFSTIVERTRYTFHGSNLTLFEIVFDKLVSPRAVRAILRRCPDARVVCATKRIFVGLTPQNTLVWTEDLTDSNHVAFATTTPRTEHAVVAAHPQPVMNMVQVGVRYVKMECHHGELAGRAVYLKCDTSGQPIVANGMVSTPRNTLPAHDFKLEPSSPVALQSPTIHVGDHIAYLVPAIPAQHQSHFITTRVVAINQTSTCPLVLENGHHNTILSSGQDEIVKLCIQTNRIVPPVDVMRNFTVLP